MTRFKWLLCALLFTAFFGGEARANTLQAATCNTSAVQTAINSAARGDTVIIPAGTCTWTSGVSISGKGLNVIGAGSGRIIAYDDGTEVLTVSTGTLTVNIGGYSPGFGGSNLPNGTTLRVFENGARQNWMQGTVTSNSGSVLTMNITSTGGSGSTHRWLVASVPSTVIINNSGSVLFSVTEDSSFHTSLSGVKIAVGSGTGDGVDFIFGSGGQAILLHDCWIESGAGSGDAVRSNTNRGVVWNCSFDSSPFSMAPLAIHIKDAPATSWTTASTWGTSDTTGQNNIYVETNDFEAWLNAADNDDNGRLVFRYNLMNNAGFGTHGADTSNYGQRFFEYYNNAGIFNAYSDGTTFNMNWWLFVRGGSFVVHDNLLPPIQSQDYGTKGDANLIVMNLQRNAGPNPCWGSGTSGGTRYHAPRQVGMGRVTGTGSANYPPDGVNNSSTDSITYVGDSEPAYIWSNSRVPLGNTGTSDFGGTACTNPDTSANYIVLNRDYFNGSTAKPGYTPYTYPHPLTSGSVASSVPAPPSNLTAAVN